MNLFVDVKLFEDVVHVATQSVREVCNVSGLDVRLLLEIADIPVQLTCLELSLVKFDGRLFQLLSERSNLLLLALQLLLVASDRSLNSNIWVTLRFGATVDARIVTQFLVTLGFFQIELLGGSCVMFS